MTEDHPETVFATWAVKVEAGEDLPFAELLHANQDCAEELRKLHDDWKLFAPLLGRVVPGLIASSEGMSLPPLSVGDEDAPEMPSSELLDRLGIHAPNSGRYRFRSVIGRGGGGIVLKVWDTKLNRPLAMKVVLGRGEAHPTGDTPKVDGRTLSRFVDEARIASQLNHPGIVPVHELGADESGRAFFTMKLVKGEDLSVKLGHVKSGKDGWNQTRALTVILRACEAMAFAHDKGVVHRDLKPANIMVGSYGEVYVMDWGLARVLGEKDHRDIRIKPRPNQSVVDSLRTADRDGAGDSPLLTIDGVPIGTPAYMSPEQAKGDLEAVGVRSDVYAIGAMLYELVAGQMPYVAPGTHVGAYTVVRWVIEGPPKPLTELTERAPAELIAIVDKAMSRDPSGRYSDTRALAEDLRAFLERRVVAAYERGTWAEARKWTQRNRLASTSLALAMLTALASVGVTTKVVTDTAAQAQLDHLARDTDVKLSRLQADLDAAEKAVNFVTLSARDELADLEARAATLWPARPELVPAFESWIADAELLLHGRASDPVRGISAKPSLKEYEARLVTLAVQNPVSTIGALGSHQADRHSGFNGDFDRLLYERMSQIVADLRDFTDDAKGGLYSRGISTNHGWGILRRLESARSIEERSITGTDAKGLWAIAMDSIAASPVYGNLRIAPQFGLLPLAMDAHSGLWTFAHLETGAPPTLDSDGKLVHAQDSGLVLVLAPAHSDGIAIEMGGHGVTKYIPRHPHEASPTCDGAHLPRLVSQYHLTYAQWERCTGHAPSTYDHEPMDPVDHNEESERAAILARFGLTLIPGLNSSEGAGSHLPHSPWTVARPLEICMTCSGKGVGQAVQCSNRCFAGYVRCVQCMGMGNWYTKCTSYGCENGRKRVDSPTNSWVHCGGCLKGSVDLPCSRCDGTGRFQCPASACKKGVRMLPCSSCGR